MTYLDIISEALSEKTNIPKEFVVKFVAKYCASSGQDGELLRYVMSVQFPEEEAQILLSDLKKKSIEELTFYISQSIKILRQEEKRQAILN